MPSVIIGTSCLALYKIVPFFQSALDSKIVEVGISRWGRSLLLLKISCDFLTNREGAMVSAFVFGMPIL